MGQQLGAKLGKLVDITECSILVLGLDNSGKSSIVDCMRTRNETGQPGRNRTAAGKVSTTPTIGFRLERVRVHSVVMTLIDMSGQGRYRNLWKYYYKECDAIVFVVDSSDRNRLPVAYDEKALMLLHLNVAKRSIPIVYFSNKVDRPGSLACDEVSKVLDLQGQAVGNKPWKIFCCSALNGTGVTAGFEWLAEQLVITRHPD